MFVSSKFLPSNKRGTVVSLDDGNHVCLWKNMNIHRNISNNFTSLNFPILFPVSFIGSFQHQLCPYVVYLVVLLQKHSWIILTKIHIDKKMKIQEINK